MLSQGYGWDALPFRDAIADCVIVSGFLHIVPDPQKVLREVRHVLKPRGRLLLTVSLVFPYTPEPTDYWRFTEEGVLWLLHNTGFAEIDIMPVGNRFSACAYLLTPFLRPRWLVAPLVYLLCLLLDHTVAHFGLRPCPIGYVVWARKP